METFNGEFQRFYKEMMREEPQTGVLFSAGRPVFRHPFGANIQNLEDKNEDSSSSLDTNQIYEQFPNENSLLLFNAALTNR
jgi:hypothetical protein